MNLLVRKTFNLAQTTLFRCNVRRISGEAVLKTQSGIIRTLSESTPVEYLQKFVISLHNTTGLPWWATIVCTTIFLRSAVTIPLAIYQHYILAKVQNARIEFTELQKELQKEVAIAIKLYNWDDKTAKFHYKRSLKKQWNLLIVRDNCHPVKASLLIWFQIPLWVCFSTTLRNIVYKLPENAPNSVTVFNELSTSSFYWISSLTEVDSTFILPILFGIMNLLIIEIQSLSKNAPPTKIQKFIINFGRGLTIVLVPIAASVPSCLPLYWTTSSLYGCLQNLVLMSPKFKRICCIPTTSTDLQKPYSHILKGFKRKFLFLKKE
ncbi:hypothetical protein FQA39_LY12633 [Lamprigera yunnana]|nr:hypothetical protein FQA39_LY12633 [Lamprigera yunnana]